MTVTADVVFVAFVGLALLGQLGVFRALAAWRRRDRLPPDAFR